MLNWGVIGFGRMGKQYVDCLRKESNIFNLISDAKSANSNKNNPFSSNMSCTSFRNLFGSCMS